MSPTRRSPHEVRHSASPLHQQQLYVGFVATSWPRSTPAASLVLRKDRSAPDRIFPAGAASSLPPAWRRIAAAPASRVPPAFRTPRLPVRSKQPPPLRPHTPA